MLHSQPKNSAYAKAGYTLCDFNNRIRAQQTPLYDMNLVNLQVRKKGKQQAVCLFGFSASVALISSSFHTAYPLVA